MNCRKAQELYCAGRDGLLDEPRRMKLAKHLARCSSCAAFACEMDASLDLVKGLPELAASDGFEWNVKRRILQEKTKLIRRREAVRFGERWWAGRFTAGAVAAAVVVVAVMLFGLEWGRGRVAVVKSVPAEQRGAVTSVTPYGGPGSGAEMTETGMYPGPRMVSDNLYRRETGGVVRQGPFQLVSVSREDSLMQQNELLKQRIASLERQIVVLKSMLYEERTNRTNLSLP
jgi:hypothetical protein